MALLCSAVYWLQWFAEHVISERESGTVTRDVSGTCVRRELPAC